MTNLYSVDVNIIATMYIMADSVEEAKAIADSTKHSHLELPNGYIGDGVYITGEAYSPNMPIFSLSPAMTLYGPPYDDIPCLVEEFEEE